MKSNFIALLLVIYSSSCIANAESLTQEQLAIKTLITKMYAIDPDTFEFAEFGAQYKKCEVVVEGNYDPERQCRLLAEFLAKEAILKKNKGPSCMTGVHGYFRYPSLDSMDLSHSECPPPPPTPHINTPLVNGDKAKVHVTFPVNGTNVMYFLRRMPEGWRIYRVESSENSATIDTMSQGDRVNVFPPENQPK